MWITNTNQYDPCAWKNSFYSSFCWRLNLKKCWVTPLFTLQELWVVSISQELILWDIIQSLQGFGFCLGFSSLARERSLAAWQFSLCISRTLQAGWAWKWLVKNRLQLKLHLVLISPVKHTNVCIIQWFLTQDRTLEFL